MVVYFDVVCKVETKEVVLCSVDVSVVDISTCSVVSSIPTVVSTTLGVDLVVDKVELVGGNLVVLGRVNLVVRLVVESVDEAVVGKTSLTVVDVSPFPSDVVLGVVWVVISVVDCVVLTSSQLSIHSTSSSG